MKHRLSNRNQEMWLNFSQVSEFYGKDNASKIVISKNMSFLKFHPFNFKSMTNIYYFLVTHGHYVLAYGIATPQEVIKNGLLPLVESHLLIFVSLVHRIWKRSIAS